MNDDTAGIASGPAAGPAFGGGTPLLVVTTVATREQARALARALVELRLAACAQIESIESVYRWKGAIEHDDECRVLFKCVASRYDEVEAAIRARHPYELPAIHAIPTTHAEAAYARWVHEETRSPSVGASAAS